MTSPSDLMGLWNRQVFFNSVNDELTLYMSERNGLCLWRALKLCHDAGEAMPPNLIAKFSDWAGKLEAATTPREVARILELSGDDGQYKGRKHLRAIEKRRHVASRVDQVRKLYKTTLKKAFALVAMSTGLSFAKVKGDYYAFFKPRTQKATPNPLDVAMRAWGKS